MTWLASIWQPQPKRTCIRRCKMWRSQPLPSPLMHQRYVAFESHLTMIYDVLCFLQNFHTSVHFLFLNLHIQTKRNMLFNNVDKYDFFGPRYSAAIQFFGINHKWEWLLVISVFLFCCLLPKFSWCKWTSNYNEDLKKTPILYNFMINSLEHLSFFY